ncbi:DNA polymerase [Camelimonas fluminis]|uniref:Uracil-DNA glycosylase family protein n=1 Tax=Camelimonas fluminis TaxID=1576911 RepID=A0ABV7UIR0_9HYPH|nr:uracil-DNA glycosylase family protein [Camelimonas fluminis]GHE73914.1 DNA polymerase [Camelimonas fluminis]
MLIQNVPPPPPTNIPHNALAGPVLPQIPIFEWNGLAILGEAPGRQEAISGVPFSGPAGELLDTLLSRVDIERHETLVLNPFLYQPVWTPLDNGTRRNNDISNFFTKDAAEGNTKIHDGALFRSAYAKNSNAHDLRYCWTVLNHVKPRAILALGATALWFLTGHDKISEHRGNVLKTPMLDDAPVIPSYHPAYALYRNADQEILNTIIADIALVKPFLAQ